MKTSFCFYMTFGQLFLVFPVANFKCFNFGTTAKCLVLNKIYYKLFSIKNKRYSYSIMKKKYLYFAITLQRSLIDYSFNFLYEFIAH